MKMKIFHSLLIFRGFDLKSLKSYALKVIQRNDVSVHFEVLKVLLTSNMIHIL